MSISSLVNRNVVSERGRTSMRLEPELWDMLTEISERQGQDISKLVREIEAAGPTCGRTSAVRVYITNYFRNAADEVGHAGAGHGSIERKLSELTLIAARNDPDAKIRHNEPFTTDNAEFSAAGQRTGRLPAIIDDLSTSYSTRMT